MKQANTSLISKPTAFPVEWKREVANWLEQTIKGVAQLIKNLKNSFNQNREVFRWAFRNREIIGLKGCISGSLPFEIIKTLEI